MSGALAVAQGVFIAPRARARSVVAGPPEPPPVVAVLCDAAGARASSAAVALALARTTGRSCAIAASVGASGAPAALATAVPAARRAAARLRERHQRATPSGRLVWLGGVRPAWSVVDADAAGAAAAAGAALGRATGTVGAPGALAIPLARTAALDRILRWFDGIVVVRVAGTADPLPAPMRQSLAALDRPVAEMPHPARLPAAAASLGIAAPAVALHAVAELGFGGRRP